MDVPAAAAPTPTLIPAPPAPVPVVLSIGGNGGTAASSSGVTAATRSGTAAQSTPASTQQNDTTLSPVVAKLFNAAAQNVEVSFQVTTNPDEVVTVFTDRSTGKEIIQFPSQALIALAELYDKDAGKVLDKSV